MLRLKKCIIKSTQFGVLFSINSLYNISLMIKFHRIMAVVATKGRHCDIIYLYPLWCLELSFLIGSRELSSLFAVVIY
uniref:Uncharacterized protein n=1 Tax=virus sp. ctDYl1 TaxID=2826795 RepID=A0A8S5R905_9VIRU|nr:MAG TPA: hypothetical protein [virus sp. ctDYl1]